MAEKIKAEVTGRVWKIIAKAGDQVAADDEIIILESMKMEIPVAAPRAGQVVEIVVAEGDPVEEGQHVVTLE